MTSAGQMWLVALREMRERSRTRAFRASLVLMILIVVAMIVLPSALDDDEVAYDVGLTGAISHELPDAIRSQATAAGSEEVGIDRFDDVSTGEQAVRDGDVDVLVVDGERLEWRRDVDRDLELLVVGAIHAVAVRERAGESGIDPDALTALMTPVPVTNVELGQVAGRNADDEAAALIMTVLLFVAISTYGAMVMSGVVEEKTSRVVEVVLARMPARNLLAGKVVGIGLLGLGQLTVTALAALAARDFVDSFDVPAVRGSVLAWAIVWFVLGYALYATVFGALGALASRAEDAQSAAGPVTVVLIAAYFVSFAAIGSPEAAWAKSISYFPATAPLAMPNRLAMGVTSWWEPMLAVVFTLAAIAGLVVFGGRVYSGGILHGGPTLTVRSAYRGVVPAGRHRPEVSSDSGVADGRHLNGLDRSQHRPSRSARWWVSASIAVGLALGVVVAAVNHDVIAGVAVCAGFCAVSTRIVRSLFDRRT